MSELKIGEIAWERKQAGEAKDEKTAELQIMYAGSGAPKTARTTLALMAFATATGRRDAENAEKIKCVTLFAQLIMGTATLL